MTEQEVKAIVGVCGAASVGFTDTTYANQGPKTVQPPYSADQEQRE